VAEAVRVGLIDAIATVFGDNMVLIWTPHFDPGQKAFPNARLSSGLQGMAALVPAVKIAHHIHVRRIGSPDSKIRALSLTKAQGMRPELFIEARVCALIEVM
jgi:hypothetical protein